MRVRVFLQSSAVNDALELLRRSRKVEVVCEPLDNVRSWAQDGSVCDLVYVDVKGITESEQRKLLNYLLRKLETPIGILDPYDEIGDPAAWFRGGIADYAGSAVIAEELSSSRIFRVVEWARGSGPRFTALTEPVTEDSVNAEDSVGTEDSVDERGRNGNQASRRQATGYETIGNRLYEEGFPVEPVVPEDLRPSSADWNEIRTGQQYTFAAMYVGVDLDSTVIRDASTELVNSSLVRFQKALQEVIAPYDGRLWFWKEFSGMILFPFDGKRGDSITAAMRIMLRRLFWQAEERTNFVTKHFHMAMHVGNVEYHRGTGRETLVSELVNFMFHLGESYAPRDEFILSRHILSYCPSGLRRYFRHFGSFQDLEFWRMQRPLTPKEAQLTYEKNVW